ncbi:MAG: hypothetical protein JWM91_880 [Rhodospirillales bacterium]|nr:hypothetical protein [Rhodospirillales bacterium]
MRGLRALLGNPPADPGERDLNDQERHLTDVVERGVNERRIDRDQADRAFNELRTIRAQQDDLRARHGGRLTEADHDYLRDRLASLDRQIDQQTREAGDRSRDKDQADRGGHDRDRGDFGDRAPKSLDEREDWLDRKIHDGMADGSLDRGEAGQALRQLRSIRQDEARYRRRDRGNLSDDHQASLMDRLDDLGRQLHWDRGH